MKEGTETHIEEDRKTDNIMKETRRRVFLARLPTHTHTCTHSMLLVQTSASDMEGVVERDSASFTSASFMLGFFCTALIL